MRHDFDYWRAFIKPNPLLVDINIGGLRRNPASFCNQSYYLLHPMVVKTKDGDKWARFRIVPNGYDQSIPDEGMLQGIEAQRTFWCQIRSRNVEEYPQDYLRAEFRGRCRPADDDAQPTYLVQMQLHDIDTSRPLYNNPLLDTRFTWNPETSPWTNMATFSPDTALSEHDTLRLHFNPGHHPKGFSLYSASAIHDFRVVMWARVRIYMVARWFRLLTRVPCPNFVKIILLVLFLLIFPPTTLLAILLLLLFPIILISSCRNKTDKGLYEITPCHAPGENFYWMYYLEHHHGNAAVANSTADDAESVNASGSA